LHRGEVSRCGYNFDAFFPFSSESKRRPDAFDTKFREIFNNFIVSHSGSQPAQNVTHTDACILDARFSETDVRIDADEFTIIFHKKILLNDNKVRGLNGRNHRPSGYVPSCVFYMQGGPYDRTVSLREWKPGVDVQSVLRSFIPGEPAPVRRGKPGVDAHSVLR
jgi:hypothetical protein